jgi:hypothetical protein
MADCVHNNFAVFGEVNRLFDDEGSEPTAEMMLPDRFSLDVTVNCHDCGERFVFIGMPIGMSPRQPMSSFDGKEARMPIRPASAPSGWGETGTSVTLRG